MVGEWGSKIRVKTGKMSGKRKYEWEQNICTGTENKHRDRKYELVSENMTRERKYEL